MKKEIFIVNVNDFMPEVFKLTYPTILKYAKKINAKVTLITERKFKDVSITYEKAQIYELGKDNDWNISIDADIAISNKLPDVTEIVPETHVGVHMAFKASLLFKCDKYFYRDGRDVALSSDFMAVSQMCHDVWTPLDPLEYVDKCPEEYCFSRNLARFGLKFAGIIPDESLIFHLNSTTYTGEHTIEQLSSYISYFC